MSTNNTEMKNVTSLTGKISEGLEKGQMAQGVIIRITQGVATDFMTSEQIENRKVNAAEPFVEIEIGIPDSGILITKNMKDYTRVNGGSIPANSTLGKIMGICEIKEDGSIPMMAKEVNGRDGKFVIWEIAI